MRIFSRFCLAFPLLALALPLFAQATFPKPAPSDEREGLCAFTNATIYIDYKTKIDNATLLIRDGKIEACGANVAVPPGALKTDCSGKTIYPSFIDLYAAGYGLPATAAVAASQPFAQRRAQPNSNKKGAYAWNEALKPEYNAAEAFVAPAEPQGAGPGAAAAPAASSGGGGNGANDWRKQGFGALLTHRADGISRGTGALVLPVEDREHEALLVPKAGHFLSLRKGSSTQDYPNSLMGVISLLRQTYLDAQWYKNGGQQEEQNLSLEAWNAVQPLPQFFEASEKLDVLRIARIGQEFGAKYLVKTAGDDYQRLDEIKATGFPLILPLNFPEPFDVRDPYEALNVSLRELKHWELAPANPARVEAAGIPFALTTAGLKDKGKFLENLRKAIDHGLTEEAALKALTFQPAALLNVYATVGSLEKGKIANFIVANGNLFKSETKIVQNWVKGKPYELAPEKTVAGLPGSWKLELSSGGERTVYDMILKGKAESPEVQLLRPDSVKLKASLSVQTNGLVTLIFAPDSAKKEVIALSGTMGDKIWEGRGTLANGNWVEWKATYVGPVEAATVRTRKSAEAAKPALGDLIYPFVAFGWKERPRAQTVLVQNATVWTNEKEGILQNTDVLVSNGKITRIGKKLPVPDNALVVDGTGKHLTAGIIDEHSHIAVARSVNEGSQESSAEVRIGDVIDSEDNDIYRQLGGGVTSSHLLHGSANPIGGQTQLVKLRWGYAPEALKFDNWPGFIKFALGENVKRSGSTDQSRYPQTRMGVEQVYVDYFTRAKEYGLLKKSGKPYRKDLELEALSEILDSKRFVTCHSYVQSEITMMIRVAERFGFKLNTFTHILEGYKVADKMAKHGAGGSSFSDWWAYKYEVYEAIPQNAKMMQDRGVVVAINSDDAEMARRLNQEAAKSVLYGGMKEVDAWKMVTLNPAKLLHVDDRVGSIKTGKDADLVLWNDNPLAIYARAEKTWVDGILFFDRAEDARRSEWVRSERARLIQKMQAEKKPEEGGGTGRRPGAPKKYYECESDDDEG